MSALDNRRDRPLREDRQPQAMAVDRVACTGHGVCVCLMPEAISPDEWGYPVMLAPHVHPELGGITIRLCSARALYWPAQGSEPGGRERRSPPR